MSVTHEQARVLHRQHHVGTRGEEDINKVANVMREHGRSCGGMSRLSHGVTWRLRVAHPGVRLEVCRKNVGKPRYAFNSFQVKMLPTIYRPPPITTGAVQS